ncbi:hypothetical protein PHMEG_00039684, partial [Phytophthora megakarya]
MDDDAEMYSHVCVLCALRLTSQPNTHDGAWEGALRKWGHTSNVKDHMVAIHSGHPIGKAEAEKRVKRARRHIEAALAEPIQSKSPRMMQFTRSDHVLTKKGVLQKLWGPTTNELNAHIARWLINDGLPYNTVVTEDFRRLMQRTTGNTDVTILSNGTYNDMLVASFVRYCEMTAQLLKVELQCAFKLPFLNLMHDLWPTGTEKKSAIGTSFSFIDNNWNFRHIALLVTIFSKTHESEVVKRKITSRILKLYGIDIGPMAQFLMSDTTPSARKVSKLFEDSVPVDCAMHALNLCLLYGLGMRENFETIYVVDPDTNVSTKTRRVCTLGGPFLEGAELVRKARGLNNYFSTPQRCDRLKEVQRFFGLPELSPMVDCDTRVASTVMLYQRTIVNYAAFRAYFQKCETYDDPA